jgi:hypothetical protein
VTKSTINDFYCLSWTIVRGLRPLVCIMMCENTRFHHTEAMYTLITTQTIKVGHSILYFCSMTMTKSTLFVFFCLSWRMVRGFRPLGTILMCENKRFHPTEAIYTLITTQNIKVGHSILYFCSIIMTKSTLYVSFCWAWRMVRGLRPLGTILMCEKKRFHPTEAIYTLITTQTIKVGHSILYFCSKTITK